MKSKLMKALSWAMFPALLVAGFAIAAPGDDGGSGGSGGSGDGDQEDFTVPGPPPHAGVLGFAGPGGPGGTEDGEVISGEIQLLRDGEVVTVFMDRGTVAAVSDTAVTITRADDTEVDIPVDGETGVLRPPEERPDPEDFEDGPPSFDPIEPGDVSDLEVGDQVIAHHEDGAAADLIAVIPEGDRFIPMGPPGGFGPGGFGPPGDMEPPPEGDDA